VKRRGNKIFDETFAQLHGDKFAAQIKTAS